MTLQEMTALRDHSGEEARGSFKNSSATRARANHEYYEKHKAEKQAYNKAYYQANKEYWQQYYKFAHDVAKSRKGFAKEADRKANEAHARYGSDSLEYKRAKQTRDLQWEAYYRNIADQKVAKINLDRSVKDYDEYVASTKKVKVTDLWLSGAKTILDAGKTFCKKIFG